MLHDVIAAPCDVTFKLNSVCCAVTPMPHSLLWLQMGLKCGFLALICGICLVTSDAGLELAEKEVLAASAVVTWRLPQCRLVTLSAS